MSMSSSLASHSTRVSSQSPATSSGSVYRTTASGIPRQFREVHRRSRAELDDTSNVAAGNNTKETIEHAGDIFLSDLYTQDAWPSTDKKKQMVKEAIQQANVVAPTKGNGQILSTKNVLTEVNKPVILASWSRLMFSARSSTRGHSCATDSRLL